ncbi:MAG: hypothetical protein M3444_13415 [Acidobacteriota bacterium]|nr:hypothetical protein [Acidobacteriota bacterium]MDQ5835693.1 hypothetical protein [Acidobacteriota bacterium]
MPLPHFEDTGDLPAGLHQSTLDEVIAQLGGGSIQRRAVAARLLRIYRAARATGRLERFIIFGSFVTAKSDPNDVDIILVMRDDFVWTITSVRLGNSSSTPLRKRSSGRVFSGFVRRC